jgi:hypothetical protein
VRTHTLRKGQRVGPSATSGYGETTLWPRAAGRP